MMALDPITIANGTTSPLNLSKSPTVGIAQIGNESPFPLKVTIPGHTVWIPAGAYGEIDVTGYSFGGNISLTPLAISSSSNPPSTIALVNLYSPGEPVVSMTPFVRLNNIGNGVLSTTTISQLVNDGSTLPTQIIETTPAGQATSAFAVSNDGSVIVRSLNNNVWAVVMQITPGGVALAFTAVFHGTADAATVANAVAAANVTAGNLNIGAGTLTTDGGALVSNGAGWLTGLAFTATGTHNNGTGNYAFAAGASGAVYFDGGNLRSTGSGNLYLKSVNFLNSGVNVSAMSFFSGTGSGTVSHGLGLTPQWVGITDSLAGSSMTVGVASIGSTSCTITAGMAHTWKGIAIG